MAVIKANVAALRQNANTIQKDISELNRLNAALNQLLANIESTWDGKASEQYIASMVKHKKKAEQMINVLQEFMNYIEKAARKLETMDKEGASKIKGC